MKIDVIKSIDSIKDIWNKLYYSNPNLSWYQSYSWNKTLEESFYRKKITNRSYKLEYFLCDDVFIAPLLIEKKEMRISLLGNNECSDYLSFIFDVSMSDDALNSCLKELFNCYKDYYFSIDRINENNRLSKILSLYFNDRLLKEEKECVYVPINKENKSFLSTLSKSSRQNYRTALNRLRKDSLDYKVEISYSVLPKITAEKLLEIYRARRKDCSENTGILSAAKNIARKAMNEDVDVLTNYSITEEVFLATITINGEYAAYFEGQYNNIGRCLSIARVATNPLYYQYSPGQILLISALEQLKGQIDYFDLTRGIEEYKFKLGGLIHKNYLFKTII